MNRLAVVVLFGALVACAPSNSPAVDAGPDAEQDAGKTDAGLDAGLCLPPDAGAFDAGSLFALRGFCDAVGRGILRASGEELARCGEPLTANDLLRLSGTQPSCTQGQFSVAIRKVEASVASGRMVFDSAKMDACTARGKDGGTPWLTDGGIVEPCASVLVGLVPLGGNCTSSEECVNAAFCHAATTLTCGGICSAPLSVGAGCDPESDLCEHGYCANDGQCHRLPSEGEPCGDGYCGPGLTCTAGTCVSPAPEGAGCTHPGSQAGCAAGLWCVGGDGGAAACQKRAAAGEACGTGLDNQPVCASACLHCATDAGVCVTRENVGGACTGNSDCLELLRCVSGHCALRPREGEPCIAMGGGSSPGDCLYQDNFCSRPDGGIAGSCAPRARLGERCGVEPGVPSACEEGYCQIAANTGSGTCRALPGVAETCADAPSCADGLFCERQECGTQFCRPLRAGGEACVEDRECAGGKCESGNCRARCNPLQRAGCVGGLRDYSAYLFFAAALGLGRLPRLRRASRADHPLESKGHGTSLTP